MGIELVGVYFSTGTPTTSLGTILISSKLKAGIVRNMIWGYNGWMVNKFHLEAENIIRTKSTAEITHMNQHSKGHRKQSKNTSKTEPFDKH